MSTPTISVALRDVTPTLRHASRDSIAAVAHHLAAEGQETLVIDCLNSPLGADPYIAEALRDALAEASRAAQSQALQNAMTRCGTRQTDRV